MTITQDLKCYRVGGSVRDELMDLPSGDRDWVVVGATPEQMIARGFRPVGKDFPVFLHPDTHEEYALARTERKTAPGYRGFAVHFAPDVTLEDDLLRRDITINAMARSADGTLIDPFHGLNDIRDRIFRHVSPAFREDPVRILRVARFAARFPDFRVADETLSLMREMRAAGEVDALVAERVWQELSRGLMSQRPSRMLEVLGEAGALEILMPGLPPVPARTAWLAALDRSAAAGDPLPVRFAVMMSAVDVIRLDVGLPADTARALACASPTDAAGSGASSTWSGAACTCTPGGKGNQCHEQHAARIAVQARQLRASNECIDAARRLASELGSAMPDAAARQWLDDLDRKDAEAMLALFNRHDLWRRPGQLTTLLQGAIRLTDGPEPSPSLQAAADAARAVDTGLIARQHAGTPQAIRAAIDTARIETIRLVLEN